MVESPWGPLPWWLIYTPVAIIGLALGSFANVLVYRLPRGESIVNPPSHCPGCGRPIRAYENIPILSWLLLGARCRTCHATISVRYPLLELAGAELAIVSVRLWGLSYASFAYGLLFIALLALVIIDLESWLLPFAVTLPIAIIGLAGVVFFRLRPLADSLLGMITGVVVLAGIGVLGNALFRRKQREDPTAGTSEESPSDDGLALPYMIIAGLLIAAVVLSFVSRLNSVTSGWLFVAICALPFLAIVSLYRIAFGPKRKEVPADSVAFGKASAEIGEELKDAGAMGGGDIVFGLMAGIYLGWKLTLLMTFMASILGTLLALLLVIMRINIKNLKIQFGPLLAVSAVVCLLVGDRIVDWYIGFLSA